MSQLKAARDAVHAALPGGVITSDRAHRFPQVGQFPTPCAWVDLPTIRPGRGATTLTLPVSVVVDGSLEAQTDALDVEAARLWDALRRVRLSEGGPRAEVTAAAPDSFGPEGTVLLGVRFTVVFELYTQTLCDSPIS